MTIEKRVNTYEMLLRWSPATGEFQGAHVIDAVTFVDTDDDTASDPKLSDARPVTQAEFGVLLGEHAAGAIEAAGIQAARADAAEAELRTVSASLAEVEADRNAARALLVQMRDLTDAIT